MNTKHSLFGCTLMALAGLAVAEEVSVIEEIIVVAHPLSGEGLAQPSSILDGDELARKKSYNIGATLAQEPGIHSASFGTATSRPVIHGLSGPRVRIMEDRIDTLDVSVTS
ncbi:MAG: Plug domain-containing protein, partial [Pseudomonadales bacterium]|nr:Plug domain-containing protein [Pseudomonadales bacterium]